MTATEPPPPGPFQPSIAGTPATYGWRHAAASDRVPADMSLRELTRRIGQRRWLVLGVAAVVAGTVAFWAFTATPRYRSEARLRIETRQQSPSSALSALSDQTSSIPGAGLLGFTRDELETEIGVLKSDRIADAMIDSLAFGVRVTDPAASRARVLSARVVDPAIDVDGRLTLTREAGGRYRVDGEKLDDAGPLPPALEPGVPARVGGFALTLAPSLRGGGPATIKIRLLPRYEVHKLLEKRLEIQRQEGGSRLVEVSFDDPDRQLAAQVVNRIVAEYVEYTRTTEAGDDTTTVTRLRAQVAQTARQLGDAETTLRAFEEQSRLIVPTEQASAQVKRISAVETRVDAISVERNALSRMLSVIQQRSRGGADAEAYRQLATFPSLITNRAIQDLLQSMIDLENKRSALGVRRTAANDEYRELTNRITEIERQLYQIGPQYLESLDQELATTANAVSTLMDSLSAMPAAAMQYGRLVRNRTLLEATYLALQKQLKQAEVQDALRLERVRVVDMPRVANPDDRVFPHKLVMLLLGGVLGVALGLTAALAAELWRGPA